MPLKDDLFAAFREIPVIDIHSHLVPGRMGLPDATTLFFYHMLMYPLRACGVAGEKLWSEHHQIHGTLRPVEEFVKHWPQIAGTGFGWILGRILEEVYDISEPITARSIGGMIERIDQAIHSPGHVDRVIADAKIKRILSSAFREPRSALPEAAKNLVGLTLESTPAGGMWEYSTWCERFEFVEERTGLHVSDLRSLRRVVETWFDSMEWDGRRALVAWTTSQVDFRPADDSVLESALAECLRGNDTRPETKRVLEAELIRCICRAADAHTGVFQLVYGTQFLTDTPAPAIARSWPEFASSLGFLVGEFPNVHFNILSGYEPDEPVLCSLCLGYPNVSLGSFWWHSFYPSVMHAAWQRRLDMVPVSRLMGFFSDAYCIDWAYGRLRMMRQVLAGVFAERIERGFCTFDEAVTMTRALFLDTPERVFLSDRRGTSRRESLRPQSA